ncbi:HDLBP, partial [Symbiodinium pilosum]
VPVKLYDSKAAYGAHEFYRKATSICGGHLVDVRDEGDAVKESWDLPQNARNLVLRGWQEVKVCTGARLMILENKVVVSGSRRQVEEGIRHVQRILNTYDSCTVMLYDHRAK